MRLSPGCGSSGVPTSIPVNIVNIVPLGAVAGVDNTSIIQAALTANAGLNPVYVPAAASPFYACNLTMPSNTHLIVDGTLEVSAGCANQLLSANSTTNIIVEGAGVVDGNKSAITGAGPYACFNLNGSTWVTIRNLTIQNCNAFPINAWNNGAHIRLSYLQILNSGHSTECAKGENDCWADHIYVSGTNDYGFSFYGGVTHSGVTNSVAYNNGAGGFNVLNDAGQSAPCDDIHINGNLAYNNTGSGFAINENSGGSGVHTNIVIENNIAHDNNQTNLGNYGGAYIQGVATAAIRNNHFYHDGNGAAATPGVYVSTSTDVTVQGNTIENEGQGGTLGTGITFGTAAVRLRLRDNVITDNQGSPTMAYGLNGSWGAGGESSHNIIVGTIGTPRLGTYANDTYVDEEYKSTYLISSIAGGGTAPSVVAGTGAGSSPTVTLPGSSTDLVGTLSVVTGTSPTASATIAVVTFSVPRTIPAYCTPLPQNAAAAALYGNANPYFSTPSGASWTFVAGSTALAASTTYLWTYQCL